MEHTKKATERLADMPKIDLHVHLDGSIRPATLIELARKQGVSLPAQDAEGLIPYMQVEGRCENLAQYLEKFQFVGRFLHTAEALERTAYELVEDAANDKCRYIEVRFAPQLHRDRGLSVDETLDSVIRGLSKAEASFGMKARCIAIALRGHSEEMNTEVIRSAARFYGKGLVAVDLAGAEAAYPPELYANVFALARELKLPITIHAGEAAGADSVEMAVSSLGATRIGHGVRLKEDGRVLDMIREKRIPLEMCPISNYQTKATESWAVYPLREYDELGLVVTVNTDNLTVSGTSLSKEYAVLQEQLGYSDEDLCRIVRNGVEAAFLPEDEKEQLRSDMEEELNGWLASRSTP